MFYPSLNLSLRASSPGRSGGGAGKGRRACQGWGLEVLLGILGGAVPPGSSNPDPISDKKM